VYLDVPMMISFLAALRGGVSFEDEMTRTDMRSTTRQREAGAKVRLPSVATLLGFDASGRMGRSERGETSEEVKAVRQHTAASLFNALYEALAGEKVVKRVTRADDLDAVGPGDVIEVAGEFVGNPLEPVVAFFKQALPYFDMTAEQREMDRDAMVAANATTLQLASDGHLLEQKAARGARSGNPATRADAVALQQRAAEMRARAAEERQAIEAALAAEAQRKEQDISIRLLNQVADDLAKTPVQDTVINGEGFAAVLTMSAEFFTDTTRAHLRAGVFRTIGKVTRVLGQGEDLNLLRRTVLGPAGGDFGRNMLKEAGEEGNLDLEIFDPIIEAPAIQVLPLAVFI
jgi:hypothetical protein